MKVIDVFEGYYGAKCLYNGRERHAAKVTLTATSDAGTVKYEVGVTFFPHDTPEDFAVSYDACAAGTLYEAPGRRSKKREAELLEALPGAADRLAESLGGEISWERQLLVRA